MIKFMGTTLSGRRFLGLGLSKGNLDYLQQDKPIHFNAEDMGLPDIMCKEIIIFYGGTEEVMRKVIEEYIDDRTIIHEEKKKKPF